MSVLREEVETVKSMIIEITPVVDDVESQLEIAIKSIEDTVLITKDNATLSISELRDLTQKSPPSFNHHCPSSRPLREAEAGRAGAAAETVVTAQLEAIGRIIAEDKATG
ncbi:heat shock Hsp 20 family protein, putative [Babesia ovata]|uniref:Heat shock Hsp 20 family protein, putative n=1 Tax=Babesia ovata TaxID=189622 RepID=A0A2H6KKB1_9APIC|nr:heat shock Hsp 20 family protein, putative [Babesia ovata]GBE63422.1 heat shock Hsp 20 family protein, putative [Babesia ovata]